MNFSLKHIITVSLLFFTVFSTYSQVSVKASVDRDKILIGEPITLTLQAYAPLGEPVTWFALDTIPRFEFISKGKLDTIENVDNKKLEQTVVITSFDSGSVLFPPLEMKVGDKIYLTDSLIIDVAYKNFDPAAEADDGSCEFSANCECPADLDADGIIGVQDLILFMGQFGENCFGGN